MFWGKYLDADKWKDFEGFDKVCCWCFIYKMANGTKFSLIQQGKRYKNTKGALWIAVNILKKITKMMESKNEKFHLTKKKKVSVGR